MNSVGQRERITQKRVIQLFTKHLGYHYLGNWHKREDNRNIEPGLVSAWLTKRGVSEVLIARALRQLDRAASLGEGRILYDANKEVYRLLRYGVKDKEGAGEQNQTVWLVDWKNPEANDFAIAEEVTYNGENKKRPDLVLYVNGIALGVIELKRSTVSVSEGIRQNLDNQQKAFIRNFFTTIQLVMAGNDLEGLRYGVIETPEKYYLQWKETAESPYTNMLDLHLAQVCNKQRLLELIHDFIVFDAGVKKTCRHNQYFGVTATKPFIQRNEGGIIWHTQGSGKSLTMVWLAKWIRENITDSRVLIITDRTELDEQIEKVFNGVEEEILRTRSGADLVTRLNQTKPWLICSLVHKFGRQEEEDKDADTDDFIEQIKRNIPADFNPKGKLFVFVDECHRTQSGKLHSAMKSILPDAQFIGFTGTPLMKKDKKKSVEVFGPYIHTYKFDEAVNDGVVLDLRYEARDIDQRVKSQKKVDQWFDAKTSKLSRLGQQQLKQKWASMQKLLSSRSRLEQIVADILLDFEQKPRLADGRGNAMLVCSSVYQACKCYEMFSEAGFAGKCAIVTSYQPNASEIKGEESGEGLTEKLAKYNIYRKMLAEYFEQPEAEAAKRVSDFEKEVKQRFIKEPGQMRLLIVVDKLLTGFDAPSATYLYIDKKMADHNLFQAICRVNRLDGEDKEYGYIVDYKDLFRSLEKTVQDYTAEAFDGYDKEDVAGLLKDRLQQAKIDLDGALDAVRTLCEPVKMPRNQLDYQHYFCGESGASIEQISEKEALRLTLYQSVAKLIRAFTNLAGELTDAGYSEQQAAQIRIDVEFYTKVRDEIKIASGDFVDMKQFEPGMRQMLDLWVDADPSETLMDFEELGLLELIIERGEEALDGLPADMRGNQEAMAEAIENNVRRTIVDENPVNPKYYEKMSVLLDELIALRRQQAISYQEYLEHVRELAKQVKHPQSGSKSTYPASIDTLAKKALFDNLGQDEVLVTKIDTAVRHTKKADWYGDRFKEREISFAIAEEIKGYSVTVADVMALVKAQKEYR
ncbi:TPA: HsdR family type I site-specific deoxyribonuclease [Citrobacter freundii]|uniref:type I restriction endonuclease subunit R n=2 Tax=Citrobacter freundii TaxID=546 RepID=UPI00115E3D0D|nr:HsdR family type I site-specific deoxyribonuclease [Citrobacter freundii]EJD6091885.1 HsdR family type I site-specific deoxyribonuclease [Citrobacter freundii]EKS9217463.1 HsdR family type I site-specific deoxyribonuclease [Citrobacter freundii]EKU3696542.1 HsdR family type I site-specific deoxyribonuclease [Citrobacter freundii]EKX9189835.1 HsdR family type I site-specific deoxyribonuclease [Citrobacter freundii]MBJ8817346.1 HsdR family type I site-specific deoxyribonuclease [Citrobacter f